MSTELVKTKLPLTNARVTMGTRAKTVTLVRSQFLFYFIFLFFFLCVCVCVCVKLLSP